MPTCPSSFNQIATAMADIYAFAEKYIDSDGENKRRIVLRSPDDSIETGCRFKYIPPYCDMNYQSLVNAISHAIDKEAAEKGEELFTNERDSSIQVEQLDYDKIMQELTDVVKKIMEKDEKYAARVQFEVEKVLGKGKKVVDTTMSQVDLVDEILQNLKYFLQEIQ